MPYRPQQYRPSGKPRVQGSRPTAAQRGYGYRWQVASRGYLNSHPLCVVCKVKSRTEQATCVDHITPHRGDQVLFWDQTNWQALCKPCHDQKTGRGE